MIASTLSRLDISSPETLLSTSDTLEIDAAMIPDDSADKIAGAKVAILP